MLKKFVFFSLDHIYHYREDCYEGSVAGITPRARYIYIPRFANTSDAALSTRSASISDPIVSFKEEKHSNRN